MELPNRFAAAYTHLAQARLAVWITVLAVAPSLVSTLPLAADDWPQYRGLHRDGISAEAGLATEWPDTGPPELWRRPLGSAFATATVVGDRLFTAASDDTHDLAIALDTATGKELWRRQLGPALVDDNWGNGPRSTPTVDGERIYFVSGHGQVAALSTATGEEVWALDLQARYGVDPPNFGFAVAPIVVGDLLILDAGIGDDAGILALDRTSGTLRWKVQKSPAAYSSPLYAEIGGTPQVIFLNTEELLGVTPEGQVLWRHPFSPGDSVKPAIPIFAEPDLIFVSASYDIGALTVRAKADGAEEVWQSRVMRNHFNSSVLFDGHLYGFDNATFKCVTAATGEQRWARRGRFGKGSLIFADGHLVVLTETGRLLLVEASPEAYVEKAAAQVLEGRCWTSPALAAGRLYLRNRDEMVALDLRAGSAGSSAASVSETR